jgi:DNA-binding transcriptional MerR regulator/methylmalonyl-CoA mutase cobalamin-binding subunit
VSAGGYRIGTVARLAGLTTHAIRVWERRYGAAAPSRSSGGARLYSDDDVQRFKLIKRLLERGYSTRAIANLDLPQLVALAAGDAPVTPELSASETERGERAQAAIDALLDAVSDMNVEAAERVLQHASNDFSPRELVMSVLAPALEEVGSRWARRELCTASEHAASALLRTRLGALLAAQAVGKSAPVICTSPSGEQHELGALLVAVLIAMRGRRAIFLGANLPAAQIAEAARLAKASAVALSVVCLSGDEAGRELARIRKALPRNVEIVVGGRGSTSLSRVPQGVRLLSSLEELENWLD